MVPIPIALDLESLVIVSSLITKTTLTMADLWLSDQYAQFTRLQPEEKLIQGPLVQN
jgi:hypothetical protein